MKLPTIIQGGMGVAISDWTLARAVSGQGQLGVVSGTGIGSIMTRRLADSDIGGHVRFALSNFPIENPVRRLLDTYLSSRRQEGRRYKDPPMWTVSPPKALVELTVLANFVEVFLAKQGHGNPVGINLLEKTQLPTLASLYGALLAKVDFVLMGAGIPAQIPEILDRLVRHQPGEYRLAVANTDPTDDYRIRFDPEGVLPGITKQVETLARPFFLPIISSAALAKALIKKTKGKIDGFVVETPSAGGHNAPPRGPLRLNDRGEPVYGDKDHVDPAQIKQLGLPFWMAGGYDSPEKLRRAQDLGAEGVQVGTAFAFCDESGMDAGLKRRVLERVERRAASVTTSATVSPTGFPFKTLELEQTISEKETYESRPRLCDMGGLRQLYKRPDGKVGYRCPGEPEGHYLAKGGAEEDLVGRSCLCNSLASAAGYPQGRKDGYVEPPLVTTGDGVTDLAKYSRGRTGYTARDVLDYLLDRE